MRFVERSGVVVEHATCTREAGQGCPQFVASENACLDSHSSGALGISDQVAYTCAPTFRHIPGAR